MKRKIKFITSTISCNKTIDEEYEGSAIIKNNTDNKEIIFLDKNKASTSIYVYQNQLIIKRESVTSGLLSLICDKKTTYDLKTSYGIMSFEIETLELLIDDNKIYARYYILPDKSVMHEISISI